MIITYLWDFLCYFASLEFKENSFLSYMKSGIFVITFINCILRGGADKSLTRPGRKQATRPNLGFIQHTPHEAQYTS